MSSWSLVFQNTIHNYLFTLFYAHLIYQRLTYIDIIKDLIFSQIYIRASNYQVIVVI